MNRLSALARYIKTSGPGQGLRPLRDPDASDEDDAEEE